ncbi:epimerase [Gilvibacter sediminis]|uniref:epimerase n=1 Tax=Gilvibacter sediminis TaxID=379071 RepID=UPI00235047D7|nr:epimerase [Gilvibacter sediminis]MDC7998307.1 epimerase [Gilvibacter sediminis]
MHDVIITGSTGMVGKGVLLECLDAEQIASVLVINRSSLGMSHPKLKELLLPDFTQLEAHKVMLQGYDGCFFCMGVSAIGMSEAKYSAITYDITKIFADVLYELNPNMVFNYVSGTGTDSTATGQVMWARVKGKTENYILDKGFKDAYAFRPGMIIPERGIKSSTGWYNAIYVLLRPFFGLLKKSSKITTTTKLGAAMIASITADQPLKHLENKDINNLASG